MPKFAYKAECLEAALQDVRNGMSKKNAAKKHGVPRSTIQFRLSGKLTKKELGPPPILTKEEEDVLEQWVIDCCRKGFPRRKEDLQVSVQEFLNQNERPNPFKNNLPGLGWYQAFIKRHPNISLRTPEGVTTASSCVSEKDIKNWFKNVEDVLKEENALHVLKDSSRVFNGDETNFMLCPKGSKVLAPRGSKNVYEIEKGKAKAAITAMFSFSACGKLVPPMLIYPYQRLPSTIVQSVPESWGIGHSDSGWMKAEVFYEYIGNVFNPFLEENNIKKPVILFVDGHKSHLSYKLSQLCSKLKIILIALYPNATRILQPADVAAFRPIKYGWKKAVFNWRSEHPTEVLTKENVAPIIKLVVDKIKPETLTNGFKACGLHPWNSSTIDFTKCLGKTDAKVPTRYGNLAITLDQFEQIVGDEMLQNFSNIETVIATNSEAPIFFTLYRVWEEFTRNKQLLNQHSSQQLVSEPNPRCPNTLTVPKAHGSSTIRESKPHCSSTLTEPKPHGSSTIRESKPRGSSTLTEPKPHGSSTIRESKPHFFSNLTEPKPHCLNSVSKLTLLDRLTLNDDALLMPQTHKCDEEEVSLTSMCVRSPGKLDVPHIPPSDSQVALEHNYSTPEKNYTETLQIVSPTSQCIPQAHESSDQALAGVLMWPKTPTRKGKRQSERVPSVISSKKWRRFYEEKEGKKADEERKKADRKRIREENKLKKDQKSKMKKPIPKNTKKIHDIKKTGEKSFADNKIDDSKPLDKKPINKSLFLGKKQGFVTDTKCNLCYSCGSNFKDEDENQPIECDMCDKLYHMKCVQNREDIDQDDPVFVCKPCLGFGNEISKQLNL